MKSPNTITEEIEFHDNNYLRGACHTTNGWLERCSITLYPAGLDFRMRVLDALGDVKKKRVLELGCGCGELAAALANSGAYVSAIDISLEAVKMTQKKCEGAIERAMVQQMDANDLRYTDGYFDLVVGEFILHHLKYIEAVKEIARVLKPHGRAVFVEPLAHNPFLNVWRRLTPSIRTSGEWPLSYSNISEIGSCFSSVKYQEFGLLPLLSSLVFLFTFSHRAKAVSGRLLARLDVTLLESCKFLRRYSSEVLIEVIK